MHHERAVRAGDEKHTRLMPLDDGGRAIAINIRGQDR